MAHRVAHSPEYWDLPHEGELPSYAQDPTMIALHERNEVARHRARIGLAGHDAAIEARKRERLHENAIKREHTALLKAHEKAEKARERAILKEHNAAMKAAESRARRSQATRERQSGLPTCQCMKGDGTRCGSKIGLEDGFCFAHRAGTVSRKDGIRYEKLGCPNGVPRAKPVRARKPRSGGSGHGVVGGAGAGRVDDESGFDFGGRYRGYLSRYSDFPY